jgi:hypothetical protein
MSDKTASDPVKIKKYPVIFLLNQMNAELTAI